MKFKLLSGFIIGEQILSNIRNADDTLLAANIDKKKKKNTADSLRQINKESKKKRLTVVQRQNA